MSRKLKQLALILGDTARDKLDLMEINISHPVQFILSYNSDCEKNT